MKLNFSYLYRIPNSMSLAGNYLVGLSLRIFLAYEFAESGMIKLAGGNWFGEIQNDLPFPFYLFSPEFNWWLTTSSELLGAGLLIVGLATPYVASILLILTLSAWYSVHTGFGYNICSNGYKMELVYCITLLPLILQGPGRLSLDHWLQRRSH